MTKLLHAKQRWKNRSGIARTRAVGTCTLRDERLVFMPPDFGLQTYIDAILADLALTYIPAFRCDLFSIAAALAAQNLAVAFMTRRAAQERVTTGQVKAVPIDHSIARTFDRYVTTRVGRCRLQIIFFVRSLG